MERKRLRFIFAIAAITGGAIILFQVYWVYNSYKTGERNFTQTVNYALEKSINEYQLQQNELPTSLKAKSPYLSFFMQTIPNIDSLALDTTGIIKKFVAKFLTVAVDKKNIPEVNNLLARLLSQQLHKPLSLDTLNRIFKKQLLIENINASFKLIILKNKTIVPPGKIAAAISFYKSPVILEAVLLNENYTLLKQNIVPALFSLLLIILSAGSIFYMGIIINRQLKLDNIKNEFINNITHELRTPISILKSSNEALSNFGAATEPERLKRHLQINAVVLNKLDENVDRVLEIAQYEHKVKSAHYENVDPVVLISQVLKRFSLNEKGTFYLESNLAVPSVNTDSFIIDTIVSNLVDNALKYADEQVNIQITINPITNGWQLKIADSGKGMQDFHLPLIFDKFYRIDSGDEHDVKGYGLGLSYVKQLVGVLKGKISVQSKVNHGTTFTIEFPQ
jgi:two-component system, OmpR family, phosphate regulon sensor histidine kinase PhoR